MKKTALFCMALLIVASCTKNLPSDISSGGISLTVNDFPGYSGTKTIGIVDAGKNCWSEGDVLYLILRTQSDSLAARYRLGYTGGTWDTIEKYSSGNYTAVTSIACPEGEKCRADVYYAPSYEFSEGAGLTLKSNMAPGVDEFFSWTSGQSYDIDGNSSLKIFFSRGYSRIRVSAEAGYKVKLSSADFIPAGFNTSQLVGNTISTTADSNANAFFYGEWPQGTDISIMSYDCSGMIAAEVKHENRDASVASRSYALYCVDSDDDDDDPGGVTPGETADDDDSEDFVNESDFTKVISVTFSGTTASVSPDNLLPATISGAHVVLGQSGSSVKNVKIAVSGTTTDGSLKVYNEKKMLMSLCGVSIKSSTGPAINSQCGKRIYVTLSGTNTLSDAATYTDIPDEEDGKGCFFSEGQLIFSGDGSLSVNGNFKHGIASDDYVRILSGTVTVANAASDGIKVNDYYRQDGGTVSLNAVGDAVQSDNYHIRLTGGSLTANTSGAKGHGLNATGEIIISGGELSCTVSGNGSKCLKTDADLTVTGGTLTLKATGAAFYDSEDLDVSSPACIRAENKCVLNGGSISCTSTGIAGKGVNAYIFQCNDGATLTVSTSGSSYCYNGDYSYAKGIKGSGEVEINGGTITVTTTGSGAEGIESKGSFTVNGGETYIKAYDDAVNAAGTIIFNGGSTFAWSTKNDAIDSNYGKSGAIQFNGGVVIAHGASSPEEAIDADNYSYLSFCGGTVLGTGGKQGGDGGTGGSGSSPNCTQSTVLIGLSSLSTGYFTVCSGSNVIFSAYVPRSMNKEVYCLASSPLLESGTTYKYGVSSSTPSNPVVSWNTWYYEGGTATISSGNFTANGSYQTSGSSGGEGGGGSGGGGGGGGGHRPF